MSNSEQIITDVVRRAPDWMRRDLLSNDHVAKAAAEEALSAMIAKALSDNRTQGRGGLWAVSCLAACSEQLKRTDVIPQLPDYRCAVDADSLASLL